MIGGAAPATVDIPAQPDAAPPLRAGVCALLAVLALALLLVRAWRIDYDYSIDFQAYWLAGSRILAGQAGDLYAAGGGPGQGTPRALAASEFKNLPLVALPFAPLAALEYATAKRAFWWINLAALLATGLVLGLGVLPASLGSPAARVAACLALLCAFAPAHIALRHAQTTPLVTLAVTASLAALLRRRHAASGVLLAAAALVKWPVWALAALAAARRRWRLAGAFALTLAVAAALSLALFGTGLHAGYLDEMRAHAGTVMTGHNNQSLAAVLHRLSAPAATFDWTPQPLPPATRTAALAAGVALLAALALALRRGRAAGGSGPGRDVAEFAAALAAGIVLFPVAWDHYFLLLAPALAGVTAVLHQDGLLRRPAVSVALALSFLCLALPTPDRLLAAAAGLGPAGAALLSHYFAGALLLAGVSAWAARRPAGGAP